MSLNLRENLRALAVGESYCIARKLDLDDATSESISTAERDLQNTARPAMMRAGKDIGAEYTGEYGHWHTSRGHNPVICFLVTRLK